MTLHHDNGPAVSPLSDDRRAALRSELLSAIHDSPEPRSTRTRTMLMTAAVATVAVALVASPLLRGTHDPASGPIILAAAAGQIPSSTRPCQGAELIDASELEGVTFLVDSPPAPLSRTMARVDECPGALPLATFIKATGTRDDAALTLWGPDAEVERGGIDAMEGAYEIKLAGSGTEAWVFEFHWGVQMQWADGTGDYVVTAAGVDVDTTVDAAAAYVQAKTQESVQAVVPDLQYVPITDRPARIAMWTAEYGTPDPASNDNPPWLYLEVAVGGLPPTTLASTRPIPTSGLTLAQGTTSDVRTGDNGGFRHADWTTETGAQISLRGNFTEEEMRAFAGQVQAVPPDDPRID